MKTQIRYRGGKLIGIGALVFLAASCSPLGGGSPGAGVAKTSNGGSDWVLSNKAVVDQTAKKKTTAAQSPLAGASVLGLRFAPSNSQHIYAATQGQGVFYSEDAAASWRQILATFNAYDIAVDPASPDHIYVAGQANGQARVLVTDNRGKSWQEVYNDAASQNIARSIAIDPNNPKTLVVGLGSGNLIGSQDGGSTWSLLQNFQDSVIQLTWHANHSLFILTKQKGLYVTQDAGHSVQNISKDLLNVDSWQQKAITYQGTEKTSVAPLDVPSQQTSTFYRAAIAANSQVIFIAANNGLFGTQDLGAHWRYLKLPLRNTQTTDVRGLALTQDAGILYVSVGNTVFKSVNAGASWQVTAIATPATINYILVDPQTPMVAYTGFIGSQN
jgi:photosystem II stability/assembly factor-like uncharacterized protein